MSRCPKVSIVLPVRNGEVYLPDCLRSLLRQTYSNLEVVVVDDGSSDRTGAILTTFSEDDRLRVFSTEARGLVPALNLALQHCRGELIGRIDADDVAHPRRFELQVQAFLEQPDLDVVSSLVCHFPRAAVGMGFRLYEEWLNSLVDHDDIVRERFIESPIPHPSVLMRRRTLEAVGGYRDCDWPEDYDLWLRLAERGARFYKVPRVLCLWRHHDARLTRTDSRYAVERFLACKARHLVDGPLRSAHEVVVWGAGQTGRRISKHLLRFGAEIAAFIDIDPRKIGSTLRNIPIYSPDDLPRLMGRDSATVLLTAVSSRGARKVIRERLDAWDLRETTGYWCVA